MSKENVILSCFHENFKSSLTKRISTSSCKNCGIISVGPKAFSKPERFNYKCEFDQKVYLDMIRQNLSEKRGESQEEVNDDYLKMRGKVVRYLRKLVQSYDFSEETFHAALSYADKILIKPNLKLKFDLTVIGCLLLAVKFIEKDPRIPSYSEFRNPQKGHYTKEEVSNSEKICLKILNYNLNTFTSYDILIFFLTNGVVTSNDREELTTFYSLSAKILNYFLKDVRSLDFPPSEVAIASLIRASEMSKNLNSAVKASMSQVYGIKSMSYMNASFVIKSIQPEVGQQQEKKYSLNYSKEDYKSNYDKEYQFNLKKQNSSQKTYSYKELNYVNIQDVYQFYQYGGMSMTNLPSINISSIPFQQFNSNSYCNNGYANSNFALNHNYLGLGVGVGVTSHILKGKSPDESYLSTNGNSRFNSNRNSEDSFVVDLDSDGSPKVDLSFCSMNSNNYSSNFSHYDNFAKSQINKSTYNSHYQLKQTINSSGRKKQSDESFTKEL